MIFDSSALIAACLEAHPKHSSASSWLRSAKRKEFEYIVSAHSLLEVYSVLTSAPFQPRILPATAKRLIDQNVISEAKIIFLTDREYIAVIEKTSESGLKGGIIYDAIVVECARKSHAEEILTSNTKDFSRLIPDESIKIITL